MKTKRISRVAQYVEICKIISQRSTCGRGEVGCVITVNNRIVSSGYNGPVTGTCKSHKCDLTQRCKLSVHAEVNAIVAAAKHGVSLDKGCLICSYSPCINCANAIVQAGIRYVVYIEEYNSPDCELALDILKKAGIIIHKFDPKADYYERI